jgi:hypothetical protein
MRMNPSSLPKSSDMIIHGGRVRTTSLGISYSLWTRPLALVLHLRRRYALIPAPKPCLPLPTGVLYFPPKLAATSRHLSGLQHLGDVLGRLGAAACGEVLAVCHRTIWDPADRIGSPHLQPTCSAFIPFTLSCSS